MDRLSFRRPLGYPERVPDSTTICLFRERFAETGKDKVIWAERQRQLDEKRHTVRKGIIQDASFDIRAIDEMPGEELGLR